MSKASPTIGSSPDFHTTRSGGTPDDIDTQAIIWHVRLRSADAAERCAFDIWVKDSRHAAAFEAIREADDLHSPAIETAWRTWLAGRRRFLAGGLVVMAATTLMVGLLNERADPYEVATAVGERRVVSLDAGTHVTLNGGTRMRFDRHDPRVAALIHGEALFHVRHDAARPFRLDVAGRTVEDVGTVFNVVSDTGEVRVAVAEGAVIYNPAQEAIPLRPGKGLIDAATSDTIRLIDTPAASIGGWRNGQFRYAAAPLSNVATDLSRALGIRITAAPTIAGRPFTGAITLNGTGADQLTRLMPVLDVRLVRAPHGWAMKPLDHASR